MGIPIIGDIIDAVGDVVSEVVVDKDKRDELRVRLEELKHQEVLGQLEINKEEAKHGSIFVAGWRPFIGWVGGVGFAMQAVILPVLAAFGRPVDLETGPLLFVLGGLLGIGQLTRSVEKVKKVSTNDFTDIPREKKGEPKNILPPIYLSNDPLPEDAPWTK